MTNRPYPVGAAEPRALWIRVAWGAAAIVAIGFAAACTSHEDEEGVPFISHGITGNFVPAEPSACARADLLSLQEGATTGSLVSLDVTLTDCDASLVVTGVAFEISYDDGLVDFIGCSPGALFPSSQLVPGTPECVETGGAILGTISLDPPSSARVGAGGVAVAVRLSFNVRRKGVNSPVTFLGLDSLSSTTVFYIDPVSGSPVAYPLGAGGYAGGSFISN